MSGFLHGLRATAHTARAYYYRTDAPLWRLLVARDVAAYAFGRGVQEPLLVEWNTTAWRHGWGRGRWRVRPGDVILVHGTPNTVRAVNFRLGWVLTDSGVHDLANCCAPWEAP
jgi:hypothetical protein